MQLVPRSVVILTVALSSCQSRQRAPAAQPREPHAESHPIVPPSPDARFVWQELPSAARPVARVWFAMAASPDRALLFGGEIPSSGGNDPPPPRVLGDTWTLDVDGWRSHDPTLRPRARINHAIAYDAARDRFVMFGGMGQFAAFGFDLLSDTWEWDGIDWRQIQAPGPARRYGHAMAYDAERERVVLFGGHGEFSDLGDTWTWDGTSWTESSAGGPSARVGHKLGWHARSGRVVLFGGWWKPTGSFYVADNDTWTWDGDTWLQMDPDTPPPPRTDHGMTSSLSGEPLLLFGGFDLRELNDAWEWDGTNWSATTMSNRPPARRGHGLVQTDTITFCFGGRLSQGEETWYAPNPGKGW
ncbi:MAG: kelch repeat-containing protein [Planctomycetota bacterium]